MNKNINARLERLEAGHGAVVFVGFDSEGALLFGEPVANPVRRFSFYLDNANVAEKAINLVENPDMTAPMRPTWKTPG